VTADLQRYWNRRPGRCIIWNRYIDLNYTRHIVTSFERGDHTKLWLIKLSTLSRNDRLVHRPYERLLRVFVTSRTFF
jgi:hypothetical protein